MEQGSTTRPRGLRVFHKDRLLRQLEEADEVPESFYDFTEEDYYRATQSAAKAEPVFKTRAIREREAEEAAAKLGPVRIRYVFPDGIVCEAEFSALESVGTVEDFFTDYLILPESAARLFTAPPKQYLAQRGLSLFQAKLIPNANLYVDANADPVESDAASLLKPSVLELNDPDPPPPEHESIEETPPEKQPAEKRAASSAPSDAEKRVPKWFKLGNR